MKTEKHQKLQKAQKIQLALVILAAVIITVLGFYFAAHSPYKKSSSSAKGSTTSSQSSLFFDFNPKKSSSHTTSNSSSSRVESSVGYNEKADDGIASTYNSKHWSSAYPEPNSSTVFKANTSYTAAAGIGKPANIWAMTDNGKKINGTATITKVITGADAAKYYDLYQGVVGLTVPAAGNDTEPAVIAVTLNMDVKPGTGDQYTGYSMTPAIVPVEDSTERRWYSSMVNGKSVDLTASWLPGSFDSDLTGGKTPWDGKTYYVFTAIPKSEKALLYFSAAPQIGPFAMLQIN